MDTDNIKKLFIAEKIAEEGDDDLMIMSAISSAAESLRWARESKARRAHEEQEMKNGMKSREGDITLKVKAC